MTTLEILAPYLPYGIDLQSDRGVRRRLASLFYGDRAHVHKMDDVDAEKTHLGNLSVEIKYWLPVLRPFEALREVKENGVLVAVMLAQLLVNDWASQYRYEAQSASFGLVVNVFGLAGYMEDDEVQEYVVHLYTDWDWEVIRVGEAKEHACAHNPAGGIDCLRRNHFAVGLTADQYIRKDGPV